MRNALPFLLPAWPFLLLASSSAAAQVAPIPTPTQLPGDPFYIRKHWVIGGAGNWGYLALDPAAQRLYIAHGTVVQVVDLDSGTLAKQIVGFRDARAIALDDENVNGYVSDGAVSAVTVFDRRTLAVQSSIPIGCSPDSLAYDPSSKLVFAVCGAARSLPQPAHQGDRSQQPVAFGVSHLVAIDTAASNAVLADVAVPGELRVVQTDGNGRVYVTAAESRLQIARNGAQNSVDPVRTIPPRIVLFDSSTLVNEAHRWFAEQKKQESDGPARLDVGENNPSNSLAQFLRLPAGCTEPHGFAIDSKNARIFAACENQQLLVLNAGSGQVVATLTTGPGDDVIGYDADHNLIFSANGAGYGSLTIIRQDATADTYAVIQNLPTLARARTLAVDPSTGIVYLVTDTMGVDLSPRGALTNIKPAPIEGSFQVVVVGH